MIEINGFSQDDEFSVTLVSIIEWNITSKLVLETFINKCYVKKSTQQKPVQ